jgi:hypothetical protein
MEKEFVPYDLAIKLKELGFNEPCFGWYDGRYIASINQDYCKNSEEWLNTIHCATPTFSQCFRWFREKHKLHSNVIIGKINFGFKIQYLSDYTNNWYEGYSTYEEAELACLIKLIEIVESKNETR